MTWSLWAIFGLLLFVGELFTPGGFFLFFFGIGALLVAVLTAFGLSDPQWAQWFLFSVTSILSVLILRKPLLQKFHKEGVSGDRSSLDGELGTAKERIAPHHTGQVEVRGTVWSGRNEGETILMPGSRIKVVKCEGLTLSVVAE